MSTIEPGPLDAEALRAELNVGAGGLWTSVTVLPSTGSTNADLVAAGGPEGQVLAAEEQTAGRGRLGREWVSEPGAALTFSVLLRPGNVPPAQRGWLPLLAGVAVARSVRAVSGLAAVLKWPNDVLVGGRKLCGILAEQSADGAVVIGMGINVSTTAGGLPARPGALPATSIAIEGGKASRQQLLAEILRHLERSYVPFRDNPDPESTGLLEEYRTLCSTLGQQVRAELPAGHSVTGEAADVDTAGRLLIRAGGADTPVSAGDIVHLRPAAGSTGP